MLAHCKSHGVDVVSSKPEQSHALSSPHCHVHSGCASILEGKTQTLVPGGPQLDASQTIMADRWIQLEMSELLTSLKCPG